MTVKTTIRMSTLLALFCLIIGSVGAQITIQTDHENVGIKKKSNSDLSITAPGSGIFDSTGEGIFGRQPISGRIPQELLLKNGRITMKVCIDRQGKNTYVAIIDKETTIKNKQIQQGALKAMSKYQWEEDYTAPFEQCGKYTYIFRL